MTYWGWRVAFGCVCIYVCILLIACSDSTPKPMLMPTEIPSITLTLWLAATAPPLLPTVIPVTTTPQPTAVFTQTAVVYAVHPGDSLVKIAADFGIEPADLQAANPDLQTRQPSVGDTLTIPVNLPTQVPQSLELQPPTCYLTTTDSIACLGMIVNSQSEPMQRVSARIELYTEDGTLLASQIAGIEQRTIPPGGYAPYRALFIPQSDQPITDLTTYAQVIVSLQSADPVSNVVSSTPLQIQSESAHFEAGVYQLTAILANTSPQTIDEGRLVLTVYDATKRVVGYRVMELEALTPETVTTVNVAILPLGTDLATPLTHELYIESWAAPDQ